MGFPQNIRVVLRARATLRQLRLLSHERKIASACSVFVTQIVDESSHARKEKKLGTLRFETNGENGYRARELKTVHVNARDVVEVRIEFAGCHANASNDGSQIGLMALTLIGEPNEDDVLEGEIERARERTVGLGSRIEAANATTTSLTTSLTTEEDSTEKAIREITARKARAVAEEDYDEAKRLRDVIARLRAFGDGVRALQEKKARAVAAEDYDEAKRLKIEIDTMRARGWEDVVETRSPRAMALVEANVRRELAPVPMSTVAKLAPAPVEARTFAFDEEPIRSARADATANSVVKANAASDATLAKAFESKASVSASASREQSRPKPMDLNKVNGGFRGDAPAPSVAPVGNDEVPAMATGKRIVPPELAAEAAAMFEDEEDEKRESSSRNSAKKTGTLSGLDDANAPSPEPLSPSERVTVAPLIAVFGEDVISKLYSAAWLHRESALQTINRELIGAWENEDAAALGADPRETFHTLCATLGVRLFNDKVANVTCAAAVTLASAAKAYSSLVSSKDVREAIGDSMSLLVDRLGDTNPRLRESIREALHAFVNDAPGGVVILATALCKPVQKLSVWRVLTGRLTLLLELIPTHGLDAPGKENSFTLEQVMKFSFSCFESANGEARSCAMKVVLACVDIVGAKVRKFMPKALKSAIRDVIETAIEEAEDPYDIRGRGGGAKSPSASWVAAASPMSARAGVASAGKPSTSAPSPRQRGMNASPRVDADVNVEPLDGSAAALEREITRRIAAHGELHPDVAAAINDLATFYSENESFDRALPLYERALAIQQTILGDAHPETVQTLTDLAICHLDRDENDLGKPLLERALEYQAVILGPSHADVGAIRDVLASLDAR